MGLQRYFHVPEEAQNTGLFRYSIEMATKSCPHGPGALTVYLRPAQAESGVITGWSPLRSESSGGMFVLRTQHHNGDYIEIPVEDELLALVLRNQLGSLYAEDIPAQSLSVEQVIGDASIKRVAARFRWSSLVTKGQILEMFDGILRAKWELDGSQKYAAIVLGSPTFQSADLVTSSSVFWPQVRVTGMNEVTDPVEVVTGVLYWR
ncbi:MAG: hypothetical protein UZ21_OP11001000712 [Microgenomates bacterium OLB22]|nr:MAG: hypothetical protein UZ21_OP11001000712 [Microgenomates bacterium OLB22]